MYESVQRMPIAYTSWTFLVFRIFLNGLAVTWRWYVATVCSWLQCHVRMPIVNSDLSLRSWSRRDVSCFSCWWQLLDLMGRQRRDVVPKCARHPQSELMFCETCDVVFCVDCAGASHAGAGVGPTAGGASAHTVIPFSIAIKRMSEILLYKVISVGCRCKTVFVKMGRLMVNGLDSKCWAGSGV